MTTWFEENKDHHIVLHRPENGYYVHQETVTVECLYRNIKQQLMEDFKTEMLNAFEGQK